MKVYYSRVDWWIAALLAGSVFFCFGLGFHLLGSDRLAGVITLGAGLFVGVFILLVTVPCRYVLEDETLLVQAGVIRYRIPYVEIREVEKSCNPLSSPALSLKRVKISRTNGFLLVSPRNRDEFMRELADRMQPLP